jgi:phage shock protein C
LYRLQEVTLRQTTVLRRSLENRVIAGVCAGLGRFFGIDPTLVRIGWILFTILGGAGVLAYLLAWAIIPDETGQRSATPLILLLIMVLFPCLCFLFFVPVQVITGSLF